MYAWNNTINVVGLPQGSGFGPILYLPVSTTFLKLSDSVITVGRNEAEVTMRLYEIVSVGTINVS